MCLLGTFTPSNVFFISKTPLPKAQSIILSLSHESAAMRSRANGFVTVLEIKDQSERKCTSNVQAGSDVLVASFGYLSPSAQLLLLRAFHQCEKCLAVWC